MSLTQAQKSLIEKARSVGGSEMAVPIDDAAGAYLLARTITDLSLQAHFAELPEDVPLLSSVRLANAMTSTSRKLVGVPYNSGFAAGGVRRRGVLCHREHPASN